MHVDGWRRWCYQQEGKEREDADKVRRKKEKVLQRVIDGSSVTQRDSVVESVILSPEDGEIERARESEIGRQ